MTLKEADQFITDPLPNPKELVLVEAQWLQDTLRQNRAMTHTHAQLNKTHKSMQDEISMLHHKLMVAESAHPYTHIINLKG